MTAIYSALKDAFEQCDIDASAFAHADHVGVAYEMLKRYDFLEACMRYGRCINTIAAAAGATDKFNVTITITITVAFLSLIAERVHTTEHASCEEFLEKNPEVLEAAALKRYYTADRLESELAHSYSCCHEPRSRRVAPRFSAGSSRQRQFRQTVIVDYSTQEAVDCS